MTWAESARLIRDGDSTQGSLRRILLCGHDIDYRLFRARRRSIGMLINHSGLTVRAPRWVSIREIELALQERARWIVATLAEWRGRGLASMPAEWRTGAAIMYLGNTLSLALFPSRMRAIDVDLIDLRVLHPSPGDQRLVAAYVRDWLRAQALRLLAPRVAHFAGQVVREQPVVKLSNARTQWGSCNQKGEIRLNWRLVQLPPHLADYVVAHEVAHLVELNHSPRFWSLVERLLPGQAQAREDLDAMTPLLD